MTTTLAAPRSKWWRPLDRADRLAIVTMVLLPTLIFAVPAMVGHPAIAADNLIQNFPLRALSGQQMAGGHLPLLNPLANSGTPLLGGMNAGSFFPLTFLFVGLPALVAWVLNLIGVYVGAALGLYALMRWHRVGVLGALVAALTYAYSGAMIGQMVHLGVIQGYALLPWTVLAMLAMARALEGLGQHASWGERWRTARPTVVATAVLWGLATLSGEPRAIAEIELLTLIVAAGVVMLRSEFQPTTWRARLDFVFAVGVGVLWGSLVGLAQLLPGWSYINVSQRTHLTYWFYGAGSLPVRWTSMLLIPDIVGGNGSLHQPRFFTHYNLPEVTGYVGVLALIAGAAYLAQCTRRGWRGEHRNFTIYVAIFIVGLLATWGNFTSFGHLFHVIPLYGHTRLQSRNVILVDMALCALLAWWLDRIVRRDYRGASLVGVRRWVTASPALVVAALAIALLVAGERIVARLGADARHALLAQYQVPTLVAHLLVALGFVAVVVRAGAARRPTRWLMALSAIDLTLFLLFCSTGFVAGNANVMPSRANAVAHLGATGRFALVDNTGRQGDVYESLGLPNMNVFTGLASVQGYGSLIDSYYGAITGTHPLFSLDACEFQRGTFAQLRLNSLGVATTELMRPLTASGLLTPCAPPPAATSSRDYFGELVHAPTIIVKQSVAARGTLSAQLVNADGRAVGPVLTRTNAKLIRFDFAAVHASGIGVELRSTVALRVDSLLAKLPGSVVVYQLNTPFQEAIAARHWIMHATLGSVAFFRALRTRPSAWFTGAAGSSVVTHVRSAPWGDSWISVRVDRTRTLERATAWLPGWRATAVNDATGQQIALEVRRSGLIQAVVVPPGNWTVHFHYHAPHIELGLAGSLVGTAALLATLAVDRGWVARRRRGRVRV
ncbi:MAG TPA: hypothetical protein VMV53_06765 [Acidimicrobiales bacterium]|nr:hypothetical protein [Acidimicrobiales bacterium]